MSKRRKRQFKLTTFGIVTVALLLAALVPAFLMSSRADALTSPQWASVGQYIDNYITSQFGAGTDDGEAGFLVTGAALKARIDSVSDNAFLSEGDDAASAPVLVDVYNVSPYIPGTPNSLHFAYTAAASQANADAVAAEVAKHRSAGFSTDIVTYCLTGHTESPPAMAYGAMSQAGYFGSPSPAVYALKWGRAGWNQTAAPGYSNTNNTSASVITPGSYALPSNAVDCSAETTNAGLVRCTAANALTTVGAGTTPPHADTMFPIDIRTTIDATHQTMSTTLDAAWALQNPLDNIFDPAGDFANLKKIDSTKSIIVTNRTQHTAGMVAQGLKMLGYPTVTYEKWGLPKWNNTLSEQYTSAPGYGTITTFDTTAPTINAGPTVSNITGTSADIARTTSEPATSKIHLDGGTVPIDVNETVLNGTKTTSLSGLEPGKHYTGTLTAYDGLANASTPAAIDFWTDTTGPVITNVSPADLSTIYTGSTTISADLSDGVGGSGIDTDPSVTMVHVDTVMIMSGCTITSSSISCPKSGLAYGPHTLEVIAGDLAGNSTTSTTTFTVGDNVAPTVTYTAPTGTINNQSPTITGTVTDPAPSGGLPATAVVFLSTDGGSTWPSSYACTITTGNISCPVTDVLSGNPAQLYNVRIDVTDNDGATGSGTGSFTVDTTAPTVTADPVAGAYQPGNWTNDTGALLSATITDLPPGQHITGGSITIDGAPCAGSVATDTSISCAATPPLAEGTHAVVYSAEFSAGHPGTATQTVNIDLTGPAITSIAPSGNIATSNPTLTANLSDGDGHSGINATASAIYLDGSGTPLAGCTKSATQISCTTPVAAGAHTFSVHSEDNVGNATNDNSGSFTLTQINYFWTWYDNVGGNNWVLFANPNAAQDANYALSIGSNPMTLPNGGVLPAGEIMTPMFDGLLDGPVKATSTNGVSGILSQRILWPKGGNSLEEVPATTEAQLSDHYVWTWYDEQSPGYQNWILVSNPNPSAAVYYEIKIDGNLMDSGTIPASGRITPHYPGVIGGPVEVQAWTDSGKGTAANVMASQRVLSNGGMAFNEEPGIPFSSLSSHYQWTWYDTTTPGNHNWILIANPQAVDVTYEVKLDGTVIDSGTLPAGGMITPEYAGRIGGPVEVTSTGGNVIASQRVTWGPSFEETPGFDNADLKNSYLWSWYDQVEPGVQNWVLVANTEAVNTVHYIIKVDGVTKAEGDLAAGDQVTPTFAGTIGGHVEVTSSGGNVLASQRVLWKGYFNETVGQ